MERTVYHLGVLQVHCANRDRVDRFVNGFSTGIPFREERLRVVPWKQLPSLTKAMVWLPGLSKPTEVLLGRLDTQNPGLQAEGWFVTYKQSGLLGTLLAMGIGEDSVECLGHGRTVSTSLTT